MLPSSQSTGTVTANRNNNISVKFKYYINVFPPSLPEEHSSLPLMTIAGSGEIDGFCAELSLHASVSGSGDITCSAMKGCEVDKSTVGTGDIKIKRI